MLIIVGLVAAVILVGTVLVVMVVFGLLGLAARAVDQRRGDDPP